MNSPDYTAPVTVRITKSGSAVLFEEKTFDDLGEASHAAAVVTPQFPESEGFVITLHSKRFRAGKLVVSPRPGRRLR